MQIRTDGALSNQLCQMLTTADHEQNSRRVPVNAYQVHVMNTFIRQSGRHRQKNTDIYREIQN